MSTQREIDRASVTLEQITNQTLVHQNELLLFREEKAAMQQQLASLMSAPAPSPAPAPLLPARKALLFHHIFDGDKTMFKSHGTEDCALRDKTWGPKETKAAYTAPGQRDTDGDVQMMGVNATGFKKQSKKTGNASAKAGTATKWMSQEVLAQRRGSGHNLSLKLYRHEVSNFEEMSHPTSCIHCLCLLFSEEESINGE
ncbi:hypothetical protein E4U52_006170 [Claviceps spartinae]|nr:hypothetical protein E4U52_006170 [Claviceps spartinae]